MLTEPAFPHEPRSAWLGSIPQLAPSRREFLWRSGGRLGGIALAALLNDERLLSASLAGQSGVHHPPRAKRVVQLFMAGAASHLDLFDFKPE
jgi:hypothetical protein